MTYCLVVGEEDNYRDIASLMGKGMGCDVEVVSDFIQAAKLFRERVPDVVVVNVQHAGKDGMQFLERLRNIPGGKAPHIILCSNDNTSGVAERAIQMGANSYLVKPYYPQELMDKLLESKKIS